MFKRILLAALGLCMACTGYAQVATALLDSSMISRSAGATGWRFNSNISLWAATGEGKNTHNGEDGIGEVKAGLKAKGPDDDGSQPHVSAAYREKEFAAEMNTYLQNGGSKDVQLDLDGAPYDSYGRYSERKTQGFKLAYVFGESVSAGLGYTAENRRTRIDLLGSTVSQQAITDRSETLTSIAASFRFANLFYIGGGVEQVSETGEYEQGSTFSSLSTGDLAENSWTNTMVGLALMGGDPKGFQFRAEHARVTSPESVKEGKTAAEKNTHRTTTESSNSIEIRMSGVLIGYHHSVREEENADDFESKSSTTMAALGWQPLAGTMITLYSWNNELTTRDSLLGEIKSNPRGYTLRIGYNF